MKRLNDTEKLPIRCILWDVDGTLTDFKAAEREALRSAFAAFGYGECDDAMVGRYSSFNEAVWKKVESEKTDKASLLVERFENFLRAEGLPTDKAAEFNHYYQLALGDTTVYNDNSFELVKSLKGKTLQYAVTNGTLESQFNKLEKAGFDQLLDGIFISEMTGYDKPAGGFFDYVFERIPPLNKREVMIIGDSLTSDMEGGLRQGIVTAWYNPNGLKRPSDKPVDYILRDLCEVKDILADCNS